MEKYSTYNVFIVLFAAFGSLFSGYSLNVITSALGQPTYYASLSLVAVPGAPGYDHTVTIIGAANGVLFAGGFFGALFSGWVADRFGRLNGFRIASAVGIVGGALQTGSVNQGMYLFARLVSGIATGQTIAAMPTYYVEVAPPHSRGIMGGSHGIFINMGYAIATWIGHVSFACFHAPETSFAWRFPNSVIIIWAIGLLAGTFVIPESPRWLVTQGRNDQALEVIRKLHHDKDDPSDAFAGRELELIKLQAEADRAAANTGVWKQLCGEKTYRRRMVLAAMIIVGGQNLGILVINNYNALLYQSLGLSNSQALVVAACYNTWALIMNVVGAALSDRVGRRKLMVLGYFANVTFFATATGLIGKYTTTPTKAYAAAAMVFLFLYAVPYSFIDAAQFCIVSEIFPSHLRSYGTSFAVSLLFLADVLWLQLAPTAMNTIGWKYYLVFICLGIVHAIYLVFRLPETSNLALEEIDVLFGKEAVGHLHEDGFTDDQNIHVEVTMANTEKLMD